MPLCARSPTQPSATQINAIKKSLHPLIDFSFIGSVHGGFDAFEKAKGRHLQNRTGQIIRSDAI
jgi:hypothetical protein